MGGLKKTSGLALALVRRGLLILVSLTFAACSDSDYELSPPQILRLEAGCDVRQGCTGQSDGVSVAVRMTPHRTALKPFRIELSSDANIEAVGLSLKMRGMEMGQNRYRLLRSDTGAWQSEVTLPVCTSGRSDWIAILDLHTSNRLYRLSVPFTLDK
ncbi:hypothetical protein MNBD_GAMMA15-129 [hydrothermal vent metagenome]|uniref:Lipoprotein n=1 Tax=hydrothermal vent metagenome TaxID=652676 RepID=A0A3B0YVJ3_9ZZZZ